MPNYKLIYFNLKGRGELIRYIFAYMNVDYEDKRIEFSEWPAIKSTIPYGQLPVLEIDGVIYHQSLAIGRYLAREAGLTGKTNLDDILVDAILDSIDDFISAFPWSDPDEATKEYLEKNIPVLLSNLEKSLGDKQWFVCDSVTWADFFWDTFSDMIEGFSPGFTKKYPKLQALKERVKSIPTIAAWLKKRPETEH
ncbi:hematopoietic prostaglandin D synthase isoform 2-T2 [Pelodytes ibericus]